LLPGVFATAALPKEHHKAFDSPELWAVGLTAARPYPYESSLRLSYMWTEEGGWLQR